MGMCAPHLFWSVRQMRGTAPAPIPGAKISVCHGVGGMFAASGTIIMSNEPPLSHAGGVRADLPR